MAIINDKVRKKIRKRQRDIAALRLSVAGNDGKSCSNCGCEYGPCGTDILVCTDWNPKDAKIGFDVMTKQSRINSMLR